MDNETNKYLTIDAITKYLKYKFDTDTNLKSVFLKGEISNFKAHSSGHWYFSLKDEKSKINAIMFKTSSSKVTFKPEEGSKVLVMGRISVYESAGSYQIYIDEMLEDGVGNLYLEFEKLKKKLADEGLFDAKHKKQIPLIPARVGVITAATGAAIKDITSTINRRFPRSEVVLFPALVQGDAAKDSIVNGIKLANDPKYEIDVLIVGRGGGSIEDLWPFNEEIVARAIFESSVPVISAVGHEVDYTIADFVADLRAPTPTGAAEMAVPSAFDLIKNIDNFKVRANEAIYKNIKYQTLNISKIKDSFVLKNPKMMYENKIQNLDILVEKINNLVLNNLDKKQERFMNLKNNSLLKNPDYIYNPFKVSLSNIIDKLELVNPVAVLKRGYSITYLSGNILNSVSKINKNDIIEVKLADGIIKANVNEVKEN
ncbi:MAG: exodeoxyribonuclease VII large subunit [Fusobacteriaceae bacterium]|nr:exodeoxyribonuclease VII large subunit [Fusobacteriaceae bacterium]